MHRDLKLGLALAVLLIGSTTAFFFRGEPDQTRGLPELGSTVEHDRDAAAKPTGSSRQHVVQSDSLISDAEQSPWKKPAFLKGAITTASRSIVTPDPIPMPKTTSEVQAPALASLDGERSNQPTQNLIVNAEGERFHVVQPGDTLSGLAARYLGSIAKFDELFELNRDMLRGPHDLKIGMKLRLPATQSEPKSSVAGEKADVTVAKVTSTKIIQPSPSDDDPLASPRNDEQLGSPESEPTPSQIEPVSQATPSNKLFVPAKKTPFIPSRYRAPQSTENAP